MQNRVKAASELSSWCLSCFINGSRQNEQSGAGYLVYWLGERLLSEAWPLGIYTFVSQAKLNAICILTVDFCSHDITNIKVILQCDLKAVNMSLEMKMLSWYRCCCLFHFSICPFYKQNMMFSKYIFFVLRNKFWTTHRVKIILYWCQFSVLEVN